MTSPAQLCEELHHNASISGQRQLERRLADLSIWHYKNLHLIPKENLTVRMDFMEKSFWIQLEVIALLLERVHVLEGSRTVWTPRGMDVQGDLRG